MGLAERLAEELAASDAWWGGVNELVAEVAALEAAVGRVRALHVWEHDPSNGPPFCRSCSHLVHEWVKWPCATIAVLDEKEISGAFDQDGGGDAE